MIDAIVVIESEFRDSGFDGAPKTVAEIEMAMRG